MTLVYTIETSASGKVRAQIRPANDKTFRVLKLGDWREAEDEAAKDAIKMAVRILRGN